MLQECCASRVRTAAVAESHWEGEPVLESPHPCPIHSISASGTIGKAVNFSGLSILMNTLENRQEARDIASKPKHGVRTGNESFAMDGGKLERGGERVKQHVDEILDEAGGN